MEKGQQLGGISGFTTVSGRIFSKIEQKIAKRNN